MNKRMLDLDNGAVVEEDEDHGEQVVEDADEHDVASIVLQLKRNPDQSELNKLNLKKDSVSLKVLAVIYFNRGQN
jgi:hypothetical protein